MASKELNALLTARVRPARVWLSKGFRFEASHQLPNYVGKCANLHGHTYRLRVTVSGPREGLDRSGILIDFGTLKRIVNEQVIDVLDHKHLNHIFAVPSAEVMVSHIYEVLALALAQECPGVQLESVRLHEGGGEAWASVERHAQPT